MVQDFTEKRDYKPDVKLEYFDEKGHSMNHKEAFRYLSHRFHGKGSGKAKTEKRHKKLDQEATRLLGVITRNSGKMGLLIDDLLAISRISRRQKINENIDTQELIEEIIKEQQLEYQDKQYEITVQERLPLLTGDRTLLWQLLKWMAKHI